MNLRHTQTVTTHRSLYGRAFRVSVAITLLTAVAAAQTAFSQSSNDAMSLLLDQNRQLQAEIQALRGQLSNCTVASGYSCLSVLAKGEDCAMPNDATTLFGSF